MKTAIVIFAAVLAIMLGVTVWDAVRTDPQEACRAECRGKSARFESAGEFRRCLNGCAGR